MWHIFPRGEYTNRVSKTRFLSRINNTNSDQTPEHQRKNLEKKKKKKKKKKTKNRNKEKIEIGDPGARGMTRN